jgi:hypothetical protein
MNFSPNKKIYLNKCMFTVQTFYLALIEDNYPVFASSCGVNWKIIKYILVPECILGTIY